MRARRLNREAQENALTARESSAGIELPTCTESFASAINLRSHAKNTPCSVAPVGKRRSSFSVTTLKHQLAISLLCLGLATEKSLADSAEKSQDADKASSPLLGMVETLACSVSVEDAQSALSRIKENRVDAWSLPNEWHGQNTAPALYAASFDVLLLELLKIPSKFPVMQNSVEELLLSWNYCLIQSNDGFFNLGTTRPAGSEGPGRTLAHPDSPGNWLGFGRLGFPTPAADGYPDIQPPERYVPGILTTDSQTPLFKQKKFWSLYTTQCFPHPDTGGFYYRERPFGPTRLNTVDSKSLAAQAEVYPLDWQSSCEVAPSENVLASSEEETSGATAEVTLSLAAAHDDQEQQAKPESDNIVGNEEPLTIEQNGNASTNAANSGDTGVAGNTTQAIELSATPANSASDNSLDVTAENTNTNIGWPKILDKPDSEIRRIGRLKRQNPFKTEWLSTLHTEAKKRAQNSEVSPRLSDTITDERVASILESNRESNRLRAFESKRRLTRLRSRRVQLSRKTAVAGVLPGTEPALTPVQAYGKTHADKVLFETLSKKRIHKTRSDRVRLSRNYKLTEQEGAIELAAASNETTDETKKETTSVKTTSLTTPNRTIAFNLVSYAKSRRFFEVIDSFFGDKPIRLTTTGSYLGPSLASEASKRLQTSKVRRVQSSRAFASIEPGNPESTKDSRFPNPDSESRKRLGPVKAARVRLSRQSTDTENTSQPQLQDLATSLAIDNTDQDAPESTETSRFPNPDAEGRKRLSQVKASRVRLSRQFTDTENATQPQLTDSASSPTIDVAELDVRSVETGGSQLNFREIYRNLMARAREPHRSITLILSARPGSRLNRNPADSSIVAAVTDRPAIITRQRRTFWEIYQTLIARAREPHRRISLTLSARPNSAGKGVTKIAELSNENEPATRKRRTFGEIYRNLIARAREPHRRITITLSARPKRDLTGATTVAAVTDVKRVHELPQKYPGQYGIFPVNRRGRRQMTRATIWHVIKSRQLYRNRHNPRWITANAYEVPLRVHPAGVISKRRHAVRIFGLESYLALGNKKLTPSVSGVVSTADGKKPRRQKEPSESVQRLPLEGPVLAALTPEPVPASTISLGSSIGDTALFITTPGANGGNVSPIANVPPHRTSAGEGDHFHGFSGSVALNNTKLELGAEDNFSITSSVAYKPIKDSFFFLRSGITLNNSDEPISYTWGIGYDDWHPGTWGFEINNWNPLTPGDGLDLENAVASVTRKFKADFLQNNNLASSLSLNKSANSEFALTWLVSWSPRPNWFIRTLITQSLEGNGTSWAYGFGYNDWRKNTISIEYNNWGFNEAFDTNFRENALITLSYKWEF